MLVNTYAARVLTLLLEKDAVLITEAYRVHDQGAAAIVRATEPGA